MQRDRLDQYPRPMPDVYDLAPKVELHLHLEGAIPRKALWALVQAYGDPETPTLEAMTARFEYRDFAHFIETWQWMLPFIRTPHDWTAVAEAVARSLAAQDIIYAEASISPTDFRQHQLSVAEIATAVRRGLDRVERTRVNLLVDLVRDTGPEWCGRTLEEVIEVASETGVVGITIGGSEQTYPPGPYAGVYRRAGEAGLGRTVHAGEAGGPENVWTALDEFDHRMLRPRRDHTGPQVGGGADLQRHPLSYEVLDERRVLHRSNPMADTVHAQLVQRRPHVLRATRFARVHAAPQAGLASATVDRGVRPGWEVVLGTADGDAHDGDLGGDLDDLLQRPCAPCGAGVANEVHEQVHPRALNAIEPAPDSQRDLRHRQLVLPEVGG